MGVCDTALRQCVRRGSKEGLDLVDVGQPVGSINLLDEALPADLRRMLSHFGVSADVLTLEITESVIMEDPERAMEVITELNDLGVKISIDDFGTGYSSLGYLKRLPAREIKIDKSFVSDMDRDNDDATIVRSTVELAHNLGLEVVAEGVETREVWAALKRLGCDVGQGYLFSRPLPADEATRFLAEARDGVVGPRAVAER